MRLLIFLLLLMMPLASVQAAWREASSDHFVIYANKSEKRIRAYAERLELFHAALAAGYKRKADNPSPSNRVTIYVLGSQTRVRKLANDGNKNLSGFYIPRAGATIAIVPELAKSSNKFRSSPEQILFHEYAHHFMYGLTEYSFPRWLSEGFAEFHSTVKFEKNGDVGLGLPATHRAYELAQAKKVPLSQLLNTKEYLSKKTDRYDNFYGKSWLLYHLLTFSEERRSQLKDYQLRLAQGGSEAEAMTVFGDMKKLEKELDLYRKQRSWRYFRRPRARLGIGSISVRALRPGEADMMSILIRSKRGVTKEQALELLPEAQKVAEKYPDDPAVQAALSEAEFDAGNDGAAIAAADRALKINQAQINAHIQKGYALARIARESDEPDVAWKNVRRQFIKANRQENDHPIPLINFYTSYLHAGADIPDNAVQGLERALETSPFDSGLRWMVANQQMVEERFEDAARTLRPLAHNPHKNKQTDLALNLLETVEKKIESSSSGSATASQ